jgi:hypothetical protein
MQSLVPWKHIGRKAPRPLAQSRALIAAPSRRAGGALGTTNSHGFVLWAACSPKRASRWGRCPRCQTDNLLGVNVAPDPSWFRKGLRTNLERVRPTAGAVLGELRAGGLGDGRGVAGAETGVIHHLAAVRPRPCRAAGDGLAGGGGERFVGGADAAGVAVTVEDCAAGDELPVGRPGASLAVTGAPAKAGAATRVASAAQAAARVRRVMRALLRSGSGGAPAQGAGPARRVWPAQVSPPTPRNELSIAKITVLRSLTTAFFATWVCGNDGVPPLELGRADSQWNQRPFNPRRP